MTVFSVDQLGIDPDAFCSPTRCMDHFPSLWGRFLYRFCLDLQCFLLTISVPLTSFPRSVLLFLVCLFGCLLSLCPFITVDAYAGDYLQAPTRCMDHFPSLWGRFLYRFGLDLQCFFAYNFCSIDIISAFCFSVLGLFVWLLVVIMSFYNCGRIRR